MANMIIFILIIIIHYIADFIYQDEKWASNKSTSNIALFNHVFTYSNFWLFGSLLLFNITNPNKDVYWYVTNSCSFAIITFITHGAIDYITSRIVKRKFEKKEYGTSIPNFGAFSVIGFDQVLHYIQLILTLNILSEII